MTQETGFEVVRQCKHGNAVAINDRTVENRETGQQGFEAFVEQEDS